MNVNYELTEQKQTMLGVLKGKMLMRNNVLYKIEDFTVEEVKEDGGTTIFGRKRPLKVKLILTNITIRAYHGDGKFLGYVSESDCSYILSVFNLYALRNVWENFNEQLKAFGLEVHEIKTPVIK